MERREAGVEVDPCWADDQIKRMAWEKLASIRIDIVFRCHRIGTGEFSRGCADSGDRISYAETFHQNRPAFNISTTNNLSDAEDELLIQKLLAALESLQRYIPETEHPKWNSCIKIVHTKLTLPLRKALGRC